MELTHTDTEQRGKECQLGSGSLKSLLVNRIHQLQVLWY